MRRLTSLNRKFNFLHNQSLILIFFCLSQALSESKQYRSSTTPTTHELEKLKSAFRLFLDNATNFYSEFLKKFQMCHKLILDKPAPESGNYQVPNSHFYSITNQRWILFLNVVFWFWWETSDTRYLTVHRTLIFLGDLARYRHDLHSNTDEWTSAADYYWYFLKTKIFVLIL